MFVIHLNQVEGVELILKALRERAATKGCVASGDLANGIEKTLIYVDEHGMAYPVEREDSTKAPKRPKLTLVTGSKEKH